jgi:hypothetical protein
VLEDIDEPSKCSEKQFDTVFTVFFLEPELEQVKCFTELFSPITRARQYDEKPKIPDYISSRDGG